MQEPRSLPETTPTWTRKVEHGQGHDDHAEDGRGHHDDDESADDSEASPYEGAQRARNGLVNRVNVLGKPV